MKELSKDDTSILKGLSLLLLLFHHLFYEANGLYNGITIGNTDIICEAGKIGKVCVALFVFLSGYGLTRSCRNKDISPIEFYKKRFAKLFPTFWLIWLIFVPIGIFFFDRTLESVYTNNIITKSIADFMGLAYAFEFYGYNATWWFMSCIIMLYLLFPFIYRARNNHYATAAIMAVAVAISFFDIHGIYPIRHYLMTFIAGMIFAQYNILQRISIERRWEKAVLIVALIGCLYIRSRLFLYAMNFDTIICILIIAVYACFGIKNKKSRKVLDFIGQHSMNIFLFHTFIYLYYFQEPLYSLGNPLFIFTALLASSLIISVIIEKIKILCHINKFEEFLRG